MYEFIRGTLVQATPMAAVVDVGGVGYKILIPASAYSETGSLGEEITLFVSLVTRDTGTFLCGFPTQAERDLFDTITNISGIGPKTALSIIGHLPLEELHIAVANHDVKAISRVPGIGKKTAERLIIEMRDRSFGVLPASLEIKGSPQKQQINDAMRALINLGYNQVVAQSALKEATKELPDDAELSELITVSLRLAKR